MLKFEPLGSHHARDHFDCGVEALNDFLRQTARQHQERGISRTVVLVDLDRADQILGFFALTVGEILSSELPESAAKKLPRRVPVVRLGRLAVDKSAHGQGYGAALLIEAIEQVVQVADKVGIAALVVDAKDSRAAAFYAHFGFLAFPERALTLFLPLMSLRRLVQR